MSNHIINSTKNIRRQNNRIEKLRTSKSRSTELTINTTKEFSQWLRSYLSELSDTYGILKRLRFWNFGYEAIKVVRIG